MVDTRTASNCRRAFGGQRSSPHPCARLPHIDMLLIKMLRRAEVCGKNLRQRCTRSLLSGKCRLLSKKYEKVPHLAQFPCFTPYFVSSKTIGVPFHGLTFPDDVSDLSLLNQEWMLWRTAPSGLARPRTGRLQKGVHYTYAAASPEGAVLHSTHS